MATKTTFARRPFVVPADDPLTVEHHAVARWVDAARRSPESRNYREVDLKRLPEGRVLLDGGPAQGRRYVLAALAQARHWDDEVERVEAQANDEIGRMNAHILPGWDDVWGPRRQAVAVIGALMRRTLPLERADLLALLAWVNDERRHVNRVITPVVQIVRALERHVAAAGPADVEMCDAVRKFVTRLRDCYGKDEKRLANELERLYADAPPADNAAQEEDRLPTPTPSPAGDPRVFTDLKRTLGIVPAAAVTPQAATHTIGDDHFPMCEGSPLAAEHQLISALLREGLEQPAYYAPSLTNGSGRAIVKLSRAGQGRALLAAMERHVASLIAPSRDLNDHRHWQAQYAAAGAVRAVAALNVDFDRTGCFDFLLYLSTRTPGEHPGFAKLRDRVVDGIEADVAGGKPLAEGERYVLHLLRASLIAGPPLGLVPPAVARLDRLVGDGMRFFLAPGEVWADAVNAELADAKPTRRDAWATLFRHATGATASRPSAAWLEAAASFVKDIGQREVRSALERWLALVPRGRSTQRLAAFSGDSRGSADTMHEENATILRGLIWVLPHLKEAPELVRLISAVAASAYKKVPGVGPRAVKVGNAAVYALSQIPTPDAVGQLALLKVRVKFGTAQKEIDKAFNAAAAALGLPRDEIEELGIPTYGLDDVGLRRETFADGEFAAEIRVDGRDATLTWSRTADGKPLKSVPAKVKANHKDELKELQGAARDIAGMLPAQAERLDAMFLAQRSWPLPAWRDRYLNHPLVGTIARRLIWTFAADGSPERVGIFLDNRLVDAADRPLDLPDSTRVTLWHPISRPTDDVLAWRAFLDRHQVRQPFKQAHREIYLLTDAERRTHTYSNRFAAHVLRQHQFNALCAARGWKNKIRLMVDDTYPPASRDLPLWNLRAEYWVEGAGDQYGTDTADSGAYLRVATDQVRFYRTAAAENRAHAGGGGYLSNAVDAGPDNVHAPLPLDQVPPLVLSEIFRDVDLFVGVASVGNDPTWQDGGPDGRYQAYWHSFSFGDLSATAQTRRQVLQSLLPRLTKLAGRWTLSDKFLLIRGHLRTYKIHLGSGNILMTPNDQYLCIVPSRSPAAAAAGRSDTLFLPFEGDPTLSLILSKAFLLAHDTQITDPTITRQIKP